MQSMFSNKPNIVSDMKLPTPKAVIFDWDNTLVDTWPIIHEALVKTFDAMGLAPWTMQQTQARVRKSMRDSFPEIFGEAWPEAAEIYQKNYRSNHLQKLSSLPLSFEVLKKVREIGLYSVVVSNKKGPNLRKEIETMGWQAMFDKVVGADDAARDKPHADPVYLAFSESEMTPGPDVWFIGDSEIDLECAINTGCTAILFGHLAREHPEYTESHYQGFAYHAHVDSHEEMLKILASVG